MLEEGGEGMTREGEGRKKGDYRGIKDGGRNEGQEGRG